MTNEFIESASAATLNNTILELEGYIKGGDKTLREAYSHIPKPKARRRSETICTVSSKMHGSIMLKRNLVGNLVQRTVRN